MKIFYGFLNYRQEFENTKAILEDVNPENHLVLMKSVSSANFNDKKKYNLEKADESIPKCYNRLLKAAKEAGCDYCFLMADDIKVTDTSVFSKYTEFAGKWGQEVVMFPYNRNLNVALNKFPNPIAKIKVEADEVIDVARFADSDFMCIKISDDQVYFDERLEALYLDYFINDNVNMGKIHSFGFFLDLEHSHKYISRDPSVGTIKTMFTDVQVERDSKIREGEQLSLSNNLNEVVNYVNGIKQG
tara:strand:+ start:2219 stop:2953 length:735 start_codon:yes stop_codon:yes gene_type:complete